MRVHASPDPAMVRSTTTVGQLEAVLAEWFGHPVVLTSSGRAAILLGPDRIRLRPLPPQDRIAAPDIGLRARCAHSARLSHRCRGIGFERRRNLVSSVRLSAAYRAGQYRHRRHLPCLLHRLRPGTARAGRPRRRLQPAEILFHRGDERRPSGARRVVGGAAATRGASRFRKRPRRNGNMPQRFFASAIMRAAAAWSMSICRAC